LNIRHELGGNAGIKLSSTAELVNSEESLPSWWPSVLRIKIKGSSSNIIDKLGRNESTRASSAAELVNSEGGLRFAELVPLRFAD